MTRGEKRRTSSTSVPALNVLYEVEPDQGRFFLVRRQAARFEVSELTHLSDTNMPVTLAATNLE